MSSTNYRPHIALLFCNLVWATDYPLYNLVLPHYIKPMALVTASLVVAALLSFIPLMWRSGRQGKRIERGDLPLLVFGALLIGVFRKVFLMYGLSRTSPIDGSIIGTTTPLLVLLLSVALGIDRLSKLKVAGVALGMAGAVAIVLLGGHSSHEHSQIVGNMMIFACCCATALYMVAFKRLMTKYSAATVLRWVYCISALIMLPIGAKDVVTTDFAAMDTKIIFASLFVLILPTYLPNLLLNYSLRFVQPTITSIYSYLQPVLAIALSIAMGLDRLHLDTVACAVVIFIGVGLVLRSYRTQAAIPK